MSNQVVGFFYLLGGKDIPLGYSYFEKFGFDHGHEQPIFNYSLINVKDFFFNPVESSVITTDNKIQRLLIEDADISYLKGISEEDFASKGFEKLFKALNILYIDQSEMNEPATNYSCYGDKILSETYSLDNFYVPNSLHIENVILHNELRIAHVTFKFVLDGVETNLKIYFTPDMLFNDHGLDFGKYDITHNVKNKKHNYNGITDVIVDGDSSLLQMESERNYTNVCTFTTTFNELSEGVVIDTYPRKFFIHNSMYNGYEISNYKKILMIKKYLEYEYINKENYREILIKEYPELFTSNEIDIYPMLTDYVQNEGRSNCVDLNLIEREIARRSLTIDIESLANQIEIFILEGINDKDNNVFITTSKANRNFTTPLMAISYDDTLAFGLLSGNFKRYSPTYTGYKKGGQYWEQFQFYLKLFIKLTTKVLPWKYHGMTDEELANFLNLSADMQFKTERVVIHETEFINSISFDFLSTNYTVHGFYKYEVMNG